MGTPWRSKKFHEAYFDNLGDNTLPDQVTGMQQLAQRYPWIDLDRAGIYVFDRVVWCVYLTPPSRSGSDRSPDRKGGVSRKSTILRGRGTTATPAAAMPLPAPCSTTPISSRWGSPRPATTTIANMKTIGPRNGRGC